MHSCSKWNCNMLKLTLASLFVYLHPFDTKFLLLLQYHFSHTTRYCTYPLFNVYSTPTKEIPCLMCRPVTTLGVKVTWVLGHPHGPANTLWVHFTAALPWPVPLVGYNGWKGGALGLKNKTTKKNLRELHRFCPLTLLPAWYKRILIIEQRQTFTSSLNTFTDRYFHPIFP
jgi:hypothetical protein